MITNLPADCCAEGPVYVDRTGLHKTIVGDLPPQCAALNLTNINVQRLTVEAALTGDPEHIVHACSLDPLTGAVLTLKEIRDMAAEMLEAESQWLPQFSEPQFAEPQFAGKKLRSTPTLSIPKNVERAHVPVDPALAIMARFGELGK
jgi:alpha-galactosidase